MKFLFGSNPNFNSFVLALVNKEGRYEYGMIVQIIPSSVESKFTGTIKYISLNRNEEDIVTYLDNKPQGILEARVIPSGGSGELPEVVVTSCGCTSQTPHYLWFNLPEILGFGPSSVGNGTFGSVWSGGGGGTSSSSGAGGGMPTAGTMPTTSDGIPKYTASSNEFFGLLDPIDVPDEDVIDNGIQVEEF